MKTAATVACSRRLHFCAGHRVLGHEGKCARPHGHNYVVWVHAEAPKLDALGRVVDFSVLKSVIGGWIEKHWDHKFLVFREDRALHDALEAVAPGSCVAVPFNPTAENIAQFLLDDVCRRLLKHGVMATRVEVHETENCAAEARL